MPNRSHSPDVPDYAGIITGSAWSQAILHQWFANILPNTNPLERLLEYAGLHHFRRLDVALFRGERGQSINM